MMALPNDEYPAGLPKERRDAIAAETARLIAAEVDLRDLRRACELTQGQLAERLGVEPSRVSKLERSADAYISTPRGFVAAMGGGLEIVARSPGKPPVRIVRFEAIPPESMPILTLEKREPSRSDRKARPR